MSYKYFVLTVVLFFGLTEAYKGRKNTPRNNTSAIRSLCTFDDITFAKCQRLVEAASNASVNLPLECAQQANLQSCLRSTRFRGNSMVIITEHDYMAARRQGLQPVVYARRNNSSLYIAVAPRNISLVDVYSAPIIANLSNDRAYHAVIYFNLMRGQAICPNATNATATATAQNATTVIRILDAANYTPNDDEILICPNRLFGTINNIGRCNFEASLQTAVFVQGRRFNRYVAIDIKRIFDNVLQNFGANNTNFNFFATFNGTDDVIFENDTIGFDLRATYRNGIDERLFNYLHCDAHDQRH